MTDRKNPCKLQQGAFNGNYTKMYNQIDVKWKWDISLKINNQLPLRASFRSPSFSKQGVFASAKTLQKF